MAKYYKSVTERKAAFIRKAKDKYKERYDYSSIDYTRNDVKIQIGCRVPRHGTFWVSPSNHLNGTGCQMCFRNRQKRIIEKKKLETLTTRKLEFLRIANKLYGSKYTYDKVNYVDNSTPIDIGCPVHGIINMSPGPFLKRGCSQCGRLTGVAKRKSAFEKTYTERKETFIKKANEVHNNFYDYAKLVYVPTSRNTNTIEVICPKHGSFYPTPHNHLNGTGCDKCVNVYSNEARTSLCPITEYLDTNNIEYFFEDTEYHIAKFKYDLVIPSFNTCIEYNGDAWHPDYNVLSDEDWVLWTLGSRGIVSADEKMCKDIEKARLMYDTTGYYTWMVTPSLVDRYIPLILEELKKAP